MAREKAENSPENSGFCVGVRKPKKLKSNARWLRLLFNVDQCSVPNREQYILLNSIGREIARYWVIVGMYR